MGGPHVGCRLKFHYFVGCRLKLVVGKSQLMIKNASILFKCAL